MKKFIMLFACLLMLGVQIVNAQQRTVTGTVTSSDDGMPIPGVSVSVKGTTLGTITDVDGKYSLAISEDAESLIFSFVGMRTNEVVYGGNNVIDVVMEPDVVGVDEVVVTALGISREKKSLGYASQGVGAEELMAANDISPVSSLSGKVAGLQVSGQNFGGSQNILIRGASSLNGNNQPLFVVDGIPISNENFNTTSTQTGGGGYDYGSMINDLNSYDVESVEVLKGSAASALYGSRGQNGVIMITTKKGSKGKKSFSVDLNTGMTWDRVNILPELQNSYGGGYGDFEIENVNGTDYPVVLYSMDESWGPKYDGQQVVHWWGAEDYAQGLTSAPETGAWQASPNDVDAFYETGVTYQNSVNVVSSSENSAVRFGYTNANITGIVPNSKINKNNFSINGQASLFDNVIEVDGGLNFANTYTKGRPQSGYGDNSQSQKFFQWGQRQLDMDKLANYKNADGTMRTWNRVSFSNGSPVYSDNPYWTAYENYQDDDRIRVFGKGGVKANFTDYLNATGTVYFDTYTFNQRERTSIGSQAQSLYQEVTRQSMETNMEGKINFNKRFNDWSVLAMFGGNIRNNDYTRLDGITSGGLVLPGVYNLNNSLDPAVVDDFNREKVVKSWFGSASVGWNNMVYVDGTYRRDYDSSLPNGSNAYGYMSISGSFIISELIDAGWLDNLKFRANYGETGNGTDPYSVYDLYTIGISFNGNPAFTNGLTLQNENLVPEFTYESEFGLEGVFFKSRLGFDFSYYNKDTENQIVPVEISGAAGYGARIINAGTVNNKGYEFTLYGTPVKVGDFSWDLTFNFAQNKNKVLDLPDGLDKIQLASAPFGGAFVNATKDATIQELFAYDFARDPDGNKIIGSNGFYVRGELQSVGSVLPDYTAGLGTSFKYKGFDLGALIDMSQGGKYYSLTNMWAMYSGMAEATATPTSDGNTIREDGLVLDGVVDNGDGTYSPNETNISAIGFAARHYHGYGTPSATSVFDADYVKLREVTFGYTHKFGGVVKSLRVSVFGRNLAVWGLDNKGIDPETIVGGSGLIQGLEGGIVPGTKSFGVNLQLKF